MTRPPLQVGMVGLNVDAGGWAGEAHAPAVRAVAGMDLAAVATRRQDSADRAAERFAIPRAYGDPAAMIADPDLDVIAVVSPVPTHRGLVLAALAAGKHVLVEWPVAVGPAQMREVADAATDAGVCTAVNLQARRSPAVVRAGELVAGGRLGRVLGVSVISTTAGFGATIVPAYLPLEEPQTWTNLTTIQTAHTLDLVTSLCGPLHELRPMLDIQFPTVEVEGGSPITRTLPDHVLLHARLDGGGTLNLEVAGGRPVGDTPFRLDVVGTEGSLTLTGGAARGFQAGPLALALDGTPVQLPVDPFDGLPTSVVNVAHVYAALRDDILLDRSSAPSFRQAAALAALVDQLGGGTL